MYLLFFFFFTFIAIECFDYYLVEKIISDLYLFPSLFSLYLQNFNCFKWELKRKWHSSHQFVTTLCPHAPEIQLIISLLILNNSSNILYCVFIVDCEEFKFFPNYKLSIKIFNPQRRINRRSGFNSKFSEKS